MVETLAAEAAPKASVPRGPNAERRAATRAKILDAGVRCLAEFGYSATSTPLVAKMARVARGSLLHQFPTKVDLMLAVGEHALKVRGALMAETLAAYPEGPERFLQVVDAYWASLQLPEAIAFMEVRIAARSDHEMAQRYPKLARTLDAAMSRARLKMAKSLQAVHRMDEIEALAQLSRAALNGLAMDSVFIGRPAEAAPQVLALLKAQRQALIDDIRRTAPPTATRPRDAS